MQHISHRLYLRKFRSASRSEPQRCRPCLEELESRYQLSVVIPTTGPMFLTAVTAGSSSPNTTSSQGSGAQTSSNSATINPATTTPPTVVQQLQQGSSSGLGVSFSPGVADPNTLANNLSDSAQGGSRTITGLPFSSPVIPPPTPPAVPSLPNPIPFVQPLPLPTGGGGGLTGAENNVPQPEQRVDEEEEDISQIMPSVPQNQNPLEMQADPLEELPTEMELRAPLEEWDPALVHSMGGLSDDKGSALLKTENFSGEDGSINLASAMTMLALPFFPSLEAPEGVPNGGKKRLPGQWRALRIL